MKKIFLFFASALMFIAMQTTFANDEHYTPPPKVSVADVLQKLETAGYGLIKEIKYENGVYEVKGLDDKGMKTKAIVSADTGELPANLTFSKVKPVKEPVSMSQAIQKAKDAGYTDIRKIDSEKSCYEIKAFDDKGKEIELKIDRTTGKISKDWL